MRKPVHEMTLSQTVKPIKPQAHAAAYLPRESAGQLPGHARMGSVEQLDRLGNGSGARDPKVGSNGVSGSHQPGRFF
ncbi:MAG: hypothetical protein CMP28_13115 [Roseibacillus sp.]|nr:hypothetical protein [Roseibacillus sp.]